MVVEVRLLQKENITQFKKDMQESFQKGAIDYFGEIDETVLPKEDIDKSIDSEGAVVYEAIMDNEMVGGAIVIINEQTQHNSLDFLYVKKGIYNKGIGSEIWFKLEQLHPNTKIWETHTPYFDKRNIHFYVNVCGFHIIEYFNKYHSFPEESSDRPDIEYFEDFLRFEKEMNNKK